MTTTQDLLSLGELADMIGAGVTSRTVYGWIVRGVRGVRLEAERVGGSWRTSWANFERFKLALNAGKAGRIEAARAGIADTPARGRARREAERLGIV